jgi:hypothetical protein
VLGVVLVLGVCPDWRLFADVAHGLIPIAREQHLRMEAFSGLDVSRQEEMGAPDQVRLFNS